ncbi:MAG: EamA family transporter, partial [Actinomycetia bacterium]|nr:EamA family transporter [Actinomycetes bacterium]
MSKQVLDRDVAPLTLLVIELAASSLLLLFTLVLVRQRVTWSPAMTRLSALGVLNPGLAYALGLLGLVSISASLSVLLWATEPVLIMLLAVLILRERIAPATVVAVAIALIGIVLTVAAVAACAGYTVLTRSLVL